LDVERMRHVKEVKLQWDYNTSPYNFHAHPSILANRYVLLNMFGKGGFAEVLFSLRDHICHRLDERPATNLL
jgi:hypothetical protein